MINKKKSIPLSSDTVKKRTAAISRPKFRKLLVYPYTLYKRTKWWAMNYFYDQNLGHVSYNDLGPNACDKGMQMVLPVQIMTLINSS